MRVNTTPFFKKNQLKLLVIGHRGAGKTYFLKQLTPFFKKQGVVVCHLDREVEKQTKKSIKELFNEKGEIFFRECEIHCFSTLIEKHKDKNLVIDVGAGFLGKKPKDFKALWLQRTIDLSKALFPDRPKLDNSFEINEKRFQQRQKRYQSMADYELEIPEDGFGNETPLRTFFEKGILQNENYSFDGLWFLTKLHNNHNSTIFFNEQKKTIDGNNEPPVYETQPKKHSHKLFTDESNENSVHETNWNPFVFHDISKKKFYEISKITHPFQMGNPPRWELRNDLLSFKMIQKLIREHPKSLISFRKKEESKKLENLMDNNSLWDWPLEWGLNKEAKILSLHKRQDDFNKTLNQLPCGDQIIKLAVPVKDFNELKSGYQWFSENPGKRIFLPTSSNGRWKWFRLLTARKMPFGFFREAGGPNPDQPTLMDLLNHHSRWSFFASIIGSPVNHSLTPSFHRDFFMKKQMNCLAIDVSKEEWEQAFPFLDEMGLRAAAVTSPLKKKAAEWMEKKSSIVNTLFKTKENWFTANTDEKGFKKLISGYENKKVVVWGGGDLLDLIKEYCPQVAFYSSRTGQPKRKSQPMEPDVLVWAVGPENFRKKGVYPPKNWKPEKVIDLNYNMDSPGLICAHRYGCQYQSGLVMFTEQAREQQKFWSEHQ